MNKKINHPVFQINDSTWGHLIKTVNPDTYTIEYGHIAGFSSKEEAEKSYRKSDRCSGSSCTYGRRNRTGIRSKKRRRKRKNRAFSYRME